MAVPSWGGGGKRLSTKKWKNLFFIIFIVFLPYKNKKYYSLDNLLSYGHTRITLKFVGRLGGFFCFDLGF